MEKHKIKSYIKQIRGVSYKPDDLCDVLDDSSVILLRANNIEDGIINFDGIQYVSKSRVSSEQYLKKGDILICASSGSKNLVGKAASFDFDIECTFGAFCKVIRPKDGYSQYLSIFFQSQSYRKNISRFAIGANINNIRNEHIDELYISMYPESERLFIVKKINTVQSIIFWRKNMIKKLDELIKARFVEMFGDPVRNSKNWNTEKLCSIAPINKYNGDIDKFNGKVWLLNLDMIESCTGNIVDFLYEFENQITSSTIKFDENCVLYSKLRPYLNKVVIPERKGYATSELVSMSTEKINKYFLANLLRQDSFVNFSNATAYGAKMPRASMDLIKNFDVINPPTELQNQFGKLVIEVEKSKVEVQRALDEAQLLFDSLMQKYFG